MKSIKHNDLIQFITYKVYKGVGEIKFVLVISGGVYGLAVHPLSNACTWWSYNKVNLIINKKIKPSFLIILELSTKEFHESRFFVVWKNTYSFIFCSEICKCSVNTTIQLLRFQLTWIDPQHVTRSYIFHRPFEIGEENSILTDQIVPDFLPFIFSHDRSLCYLKVPLLIAKSL